MKDDKKVPQLRFPEFTDAWKQRELKEVVNFSRGQGLPWADVDDLNGQFECILYGNLYTDYGTIIQNIKHKTNTDLKVKSKGNEVLIPGSDTTPTGLARALFLEKENVILGGDINILSVKHDDGPFLAYELNKLKKELIIRIKGTTVKHLQNNDLKDIVVSLPSLEEQRKISSLFSRLDNTITLQQRKLNSLQKLKKGLLQKMFPKNGENIPEIRFPEFSDAWKQRKLSDIALIVGGGTPSTNNPEYWDGEIDWYAPAEINGQIYADYSARKITKLGLEKSSAKILPAGKTVLFTSRAGIGKTAILRRPAATNQGFQSLVLNDEIDTYFVYSMTEIIKQKAEKIASGSTFAEISGKMLGGLSFMFPKYTEQNKIGTFFSKLDNLITLQQRKLEFLQKLKKGLLQQMFI